MNGRRPGILPIRSRRAPGDAANRARRAFAVLTLAFLFASGPAHLWHHVSDASHASHSEDARGQCLPCAAFDFVVAVETTEDFGFTQISLGVVEIADETRPVESPRIASCPRAPPSPLS